MKKGVLTSLMMLLFLGVFFFSPTVIAGEDNSLRGSIAGKLQTTGTSAGIASEKTLAQIVGEVIVTITGLIGIIIVIIMVYAGFLWLTAGGNPDQVKKAKLWMINAAIGLVIVLAVWSITSFILTVTTTAVLK